MFFIGLISDLMIVCGVVFAPGIVGFFVGPHRCCYFFKGGVRSTRLVGGRDVV